MTSSGQRLNQPQLAGTSALGQSVMGARELYLLLYASLFFICLAQLNTTSPSVEGGLGVRTLQSVNSNSGNEVTGQNNFKQVTQDLSLDGNNTYNLQYDAAGEVTSRAKVGDGTQTLTWDAWGRLVRVKLRDASNNGSDFSAVYDGLGRRVQSTLQPITGNNPSGSPTNLTYYYDPQVEFLELGFSNNGTRTWKVYGPDVSGVYGGAQGTGGLEALVDESSGTITGSINSFFGDSLGTNTGGSYAGHGSVLGGYGLLPGSALDNSTPFAHQWRGHYLDSTGFYYLGARYYEPTSGRFISADPFGHATSMSLYDYANGDPVNGIDPDGRFGKGLASGWTGGIASDAPNSDPFGAGLTVGSLLSGLGQGLGQGASNVGIGTWDAAKGAALAAWEFSPAGAALDLFEGKQTIYGALGNNLYSLATSGEAQSNAWSGITNYLSQTFSDVDLFSQRVGGNGLFTLATLGLGEAAQSLRVGGEVAQIGAATDGITALQPMADAAFQTGTIRSVAGYELGGNAALVGNSYNVNIWGLYQTEASQGPFALVNALRSEASGVGASQISITGNAVVNPDLLNISPGVAGRLGFQLQQVNPTTILLQGPVH